MAGPGSFEPALTGGGYRPRMTEALILSRLSLPDRLRLLAFDARLTGTPEPLIAAIWDAIAQLERPAPASGRRPKPRRGVTPPR